MDDLKLRREQLMEDIDTICDEFINSHECVSHVDSQYLIQTLCDAVCRNFPL